MTTSKEKLAKTADQLENAAGNILGVCNIFRDIVNESEPHDETLIKDLMADTVTYSQLLVSCRREFMDLDQLKVSDVLELISEGLADVNIACYDSRSNDQALADIKDSIVYITDNVLTMEHFANKDKRSVGEVYDTNILNVTVTEFTIHSFLDATLGSDDVPDAVTIIDVQDNFGISLADTRSVIASWEKKDEV